MERTLIRPCTVGDIDAVVDLERQWESEGIAHGNFDPLDREAFLAILGRFPDYFLVAECDGQIVGYIHGSVRRDEPVAVLPEGEPYVEIENLYVAHDFRDQRRGGTLLERLCDVANRAGIRRFVVSTASKDTYKILKFYRSHGFTPWSIHFFK